jgi:hypothetical protein
LALMFPVAGRFATGKIAGPGLPPLAFLWPALAAASATEAASTITKDLLSLALGPSGDLLELAGPCQTRSRWICDRCGCAISQPHRSVRHPRLCSVRVAWRQQADFAPRHSLIAALMGAGLHKVFVTDWRSADAETRSTPIWPISTCWSTKWAAASI